MANKADSSAIDVETEERVETPSTAEETEKPAEKEEGAKENPSVEELKKRIEELEKGNKELLAEVEKANDLYERKVVDFESFRTRMNADKEKFRIQANKGLILKLIPAISNFDRALKSAGSTQNFDALIEGIRIVDSQIHTIFEDYHVKPIEALGNEFDPNLHEALLMEERDDIENDNTVVEEFEKGYTMGDLVILHSKVKVGKKKK